MGNRMLTKAFSAFILAFLILNVVSSVLTNVSGNELVAPGPEPTQWRSPDGTMPSVFTSSESILLNASPDQVSVPAGGLSQVCVIVNNLLYGGLETSINRYISDLLETGIQTIVYKYSTGTAQDVKNILKSAYSEGLTGALLVGDIPTAWYEMDNPSPWGHEQFPMDLFYMDLNGIWNDADRDGAYDTHQGNREPEIWVGRLKSPSTADNELSLIKSYFDKDHNFRKGTLSLPDRALIYIDDDWNYMGSQIDRSISFAYENRTLITDKATTKPADYINRLSQGWNLVQMFVHGWPGGHSFKVNDAWDGYVYSRDIRSTNPKAFFYNLYSCSNARFTDSGYVGGWYIFDNTYGLGAVSSTKTGGMLYYDDFYQTFKDDSLGKAFQNWLVKRINVEDLSPFAEYDRKWYYGMTILGDPTLHQSYSAQVEETGFESTDFSEWNGTYVTGGETVSVVNTRPHHGNYSAIFTSNGEGGFENAYCHKSVTSSELFARGYFYVSQSGISSDLDRFFFIIFRSGNNGLAYAGWKRMGGVTKWCITMRDGTTYVDDFALTNPSTGRWYSVELHWKKDSANGLAEMWVDGTLVCSSYDMNTSAYGDISTVQIGLAELYSCSSTTVYCDCAKIANAYIGQEAQLPISFQDGFEAGDFTTWSGTSASPGENISVVSDFPHHGNYGARFATNGDGVYENAYCHKSVISNNLYVRGYFYVSQSGIEADLDRIFFIVFRSGTSGLAYAGWKRDAGEVKWCITVRDSTSYADIFSSVSPMTSRWYCIQLHLKKDVSSGLVEMWVDGVIVCSAENLNTAAYGDISIVQVGLAETYVHGATIAYSDCVEIAGTYRDMESARTTSSLSISVSKNPTTLKSGTLITGSLVPKKQATDISIWYRTAGEASWSILRIVKTDVESKYSYQWTPSNAFNYELKASWLGDFNNLPVETNIIDVDFLRVLSSISISTVPSSMVAGFRVNIVGTLIDQYGNNLQNEPVVLSYTFTGIPDWIPIALDRTDNSGKYSITWIPTALGSFLLKTEWSGNTTHGSAAETITLSTTSSEEYVLLVESNSSLSQISFNGTDRSLRFSAQGSEGTKGYARVTVHKNLINNPLDVRVYVDGAEKSVNMYPTDDSWQLVFYYSHSTHDVLVDLDVTVVPEFPDLMILPLFMIATLLVTILSPKRHKLPGQTEQMLDPRSL